jgi:two-component system, sensor histidine kinase
MPIVSQDFSPIPLNGQRRLEELCRFEIVDTLPEESFDRITALASSIFDVPIAMVSLVDKDRHWFQSCVGMSIEQVPRRDGFCTHTIMNDGVLVVPDTIEDPRFADDISVTGPGAVRFYAGASLTLSSGFRLGSLCIIDRKPRPEGLSDREIGILEELATLTIREIEFRQHSANRTVDLRDELQNARAAKRQFLQMLSHEMRTPLNAVIGFSKMIEDEIGGSVSPRHREYAEDIGKAGDHLLDLINGILDWTRLERGELGLEDSVVPVSELFDRTIALLPGAVGRVRVVPMLAALHLRCDARYVIQVLSHVVENAVKFSPADKPALLSASVNDSGNLVIRISDRGPGIETEIRTRAFGLFEKFDAEEARFAEGIGLGLAISRKLMELHGGQIDFADESDAGATVVLTFPAYRTTI